MPTTWLLYAVAALASWGVIAPLASYGYAVITTQNHERAACSIQIKEEVRKVADALNADTETKVAAAREAAKAVTPTPSAPAELTQLCGADENCRDRRKK